MITMNSLGLTEANVLIQAGIARALVRELDETD
jgi:hypothetical protein